MALTDITHKSRKGGDARAMAVTVAATTVTVTAGDVAYKGATKTLVEDSVFTPTLPYGADTRVLASLAIQISDSSIVMVVDEMGPGEGRYGFDDGIYEQIHELYELEVPSAETDLTNCSGYRFILEPLP